MVKYNHFLLVATTTMASTNAIGKQVMVTFSTGYSSNNMTFLNTLHLALSDFKSKTSFVTPIF